MRNLDKLVKALGQRHLQIVELLPTKLFTGIAKSITSTAFTMTLLIILRLSKDGRNYSLLFIKNIVKSDRLLQNVINL